MSDVSRDLLQQGIENEYRQFIGGVAKARKKPVETIDGVAQGRVWAGADAKPLGLVDELGGYRDAIEAAAELAKLGKDYDVDYLESDIGIGEALGLRIRAAAARIVAPLLPDSMLPEIPAALSPLVREARRLARLTDPRGLYVYCLACSVE